MPIEKETGRADRLLRKMHPVLSHDLPNQLVALEGLLQLLEQEETLRLTGRLSEVGQQLAGQVSWDESLAGSRRRADSDPLDKRLEIVLAHELLAACGAQLVDVRETADQSEFTVFVPQASVHG